MYTDSSKQDNLSWRERIKETREPFDPDERMEEEKRPSEDDIQLTHPENKSIVRIKDDGTIEAFAGKELGFKVDPQYNAITFFADKFNVVSSDTHIQTDDDGFRWNYCPLNQDMKDPFREVVTTRRFGTQVLERVLNTPGMYTTGPGGGPVSPAAASGLMELIDLEGKNVYDNILPPQAQMVASLTKSAGELVTNLGSDLMGDLL